MSREICLSQNQFALVDDWNYEFLNQWKWSAWWEKYTKSYYAVRTDRGKTIRMHRLIMDTPEGLECDHQDHNTLNNQEYNLRNVTHSQNAMNRKALSSTSKKNIYKSGNGYIVAIKRNRKFVYRKTFKDIDEAVAARNLALKEFHGEFANIT